MSATEQFGPISHTTEAACAQLLAWTHGICAKSKRGIGRKGWDEGAREAELAATWAALKGRFDGQKGKGYGHRGQHNRWKGTFT